MAGILYKSFAHIEFDLLSQLCQAVVVFRPSFRHAWLEAVGVIGDAVLGDGPQDSLIQGIQVLDSTIRLLADHRLKGHQHLERRFETDGSRRDSVLAGRLSHDRTDQVVSQDVRPNLLADKLWRLQPADLTEVNMLKTSRFSRMSTKLGQIAMRTLRGRPTCWLKNRML
jgi:hypothetical protein